MGNAVVARNESADGVNLILHEGDQRRYDDSCALHDKCGELVAHGFTSSCRHKHEGIIAGNKVSYDTFLVRLERVKSEKLLQLGVQHCRIC